MTLKDQMSADMDLIMSDSEFAQSVTYREPDGTETPCTAVVFDLATEPRDVRGVNTLISSRGCTFKKTDVPAINLRSTVLLGAVEWAIDGILFEDDQQVSVVVQRHELVENTRPNYRRQ